MLLLSNDDIAKVFDLATCLEAMTAGYREMVGGEVALGRTDLTAPAARDDGFFSFSTMQGVSRAQSVMTLRFKSDVSYWPGDRATEEKYCVAPGNFLGLILLVSTDNGEPLALMHDGYIQHMRMAASASLGVQHLARSDARTIGVLGSGGMARTFIPAICTVRDIRSVRVFSPTRANREAYALDLGIQLGIPVEAVESPEDAVHGADILALCSDATRPILDAAWVAPGTHVITVRLEESPGVFERAAVALRMGWGKPEPPLPSSAGPARWSLALGDPAYYERFPREGGHAKGPDLVQMEDLVAGRHPGRTSRDQITYFISEGTQAVQITAAAAAVYRRARERGVGRVLPTEWFTQQIRD